MLHQINPLQIVMNLQYIIMIMGPVIMWLVTDY